MRGATVGNIWSKESIELMSTFRLPVDPGEFAKIVRGKGAYAPRIEKEDLEKLGHRGMSMTQGGEQRHNSGGAYGGAGRGSETSSRR